MNKNLLKNAAFAAVSFFAVATLVACGDSDSGVSSNNNNAVNPATSSTVSSSAITSSADIGVSSSSIASSSDNGVSSSSANAAATLAGVWYYYVGTDKVDVKWGPNPDTAPIESSTEVADGVLVNSGILSSCGGGVCGKVTLQPSTAEEWNSLLVQYFILPDDWTNGNDLSALPGICVKYNVVYSGDCIDYANFVTVMRINLEAADNLAQVREYNTKFRHEIADDLVYGNNGETKVLNLAWSDFVWPATDSYYATVPYTLEQTVAHLHGIQIQFVQYEENIVTALFNIQKVGAYGTCVD